MAVAFDAKSTASTTANGATSITTTANLTITAGSNMALTVQILWSVAVTSPSVTWDTGGTNQACTAVTGAAASNTAQAQIWGLVNPTTGAKATKAQWTTSADVVINQISWSGVDQTGGATSFPNGASGTGNSNSDSVSVTGTSTSTAIVACFATKTGSYTATSNTNAFTNNTPSTMSSAGNYKVPSASGANSMTATQDAVGLWAAAGCEIAAAGGASAASLVGFLAMLGAGN